MTTRERWIVYPLLFLALGSTVSSRLMKAYIPHLKCKNLVVSNTVLLEGEDGKPRAQLNADGLVCGMAKIKSLRADRTDTDVLAAKYLEFIDAEGKVHRVPLGKRGPGAQDPAP
jgi:hypothetical protein